MPFLPPNQQRQSTEGKKGKKGKETEVKEKEETRRENEGKLLHTEFHLIVCNVSALWGKRLPVTKILVLVLHICHQ